MQRQPGLLLEKRNSIRNLIPTTRLETDPLLTNSDEYSDPDLTDSNEETNYRETDSIQNILTQAMYDEKTLDISAARYLQVQTEMTPKNRESVVKWLIQLNYNFRFPSDALYNAIICFDKVSMRTMIPKSEIQLYATVCYLLSCKVDTTVAHLTVKDINNASGGSFTEEMRRKVEMKVICALDFQLCHPTVKLFQRIYHDNAESDGQVYELSNFFAETALVKFDFLGIDPSLIAVSAFLLSSLALGKYKPCSYADRAAKHHGMAAISNCVEKMRLHGKEFLGNCLNGASSQVKELFSKANLDVDINQIVA